MMVGDFEPLAFIFELHAAAADFLHLAFADYVGADIPLILQHPQDCWNCSIRRVSLTHYNGLSVIPPILSRRGNMEGVQLAGDLCCGIAFSRPFKYQTDISRNIFVRAPYARLRFCGSRKDR